MERSGALIASTPPASRIWTTVGTCVTVGLVSAMVGFGAPSIPLGALLALVCIMVFALTAMHNMRVALSITVLGAATVPISLGTGTASAINAAVGLVVACALAWVLRMVLTRRVDLVPSPVNAPLLGFLVSAGLSWLATRVVADGRIRLPGNLSVVQAGQYAVFAVTAAAFLLTANHALSERSLRGWTYFIVFAGYGVMLYQLALGWGRAALAWTGPLHVWPVVLLCAQLLFNSTMSRFAKGLGVGGLAVWGYWAARISIGWKSGWVPTVTAILLLLGLKSRRWLLTALALIVILVLVIGPDVALSAILANEENSATPVRWNLWLDVFRLGLRSSLLGLGPAAYEYYWHDLRFESWSYRYVDPRAFSRQAYSPPAHNMYADIFAQTGVVGLLLFLFVIVGGMRLGVQAIRRDLSPFARAYARGILCGFVALAISSFIFAEWLMPFVYNLGLDGLRYSVYTWFLLGTLVWLGEPDPDEPREVK